MRLELKEEERSSSTNGRGTPLDRIGRGARPVKEERVFRLATRPLPAYAAFLLGYGMSEERCSCYFCTWYNQIVHLKSVDHPSESQSIKLVGGMRAIPIQ